MDMRLKSGGQDIGEIKATRAGLMSVLGGYEIVLSIEASMFGARESWRWISIINGRVSARFSRGDQVELGTASNAYHGAVKQFSNPSSAQIELRLPLQPHQLARLEERRGAGDLHLMLMMTTMGGDSKSGAFLASDQQICQFPVAQSEWVKQLRDAKAYDILLSEVPFPIEGATDFQKAARHHLLEARTHFINGSYRNCISECRQVAETLARKEEPGQAIGLYSSANTRKMMNKSDRETLLLAVIQHYANIATHSESRGGELDYSRADAKLILSLTAAFVDHQVNRV